MNETHERNEKGHRDNNRVPTVSRCLPDGTIIELLYDPVRRATALALWREDRWTIAPELVLPTTGERLVPFSPQNNIIRHDVVLLPSEPAEYGSKSDLIADITGFLHRYLDVDPAFEAIAAHYALFTWLYDAFSEVPYIRFQGDYGTGKTRALLVLGSLCYKPFFASGASTVSPLFHILDAFRGTLVLDEADFRFSDEKAELVKVLNNGTMKGMPVLRTMMNREREFNPQAFQVFGPKLVAMRRSYEDRALESRFLTEVMGTGALRRDIPISMPSSLADEARELRNKLLLFRFRSRSQIRTDPTGAIEAVAPRMNQILIPLLSIVEDAEARRAIIAFATAAQDDLTAERGLSPEAQLLEIVRELAGEVHTRAIPLRAIADRFAARFGPGYERPITPRWIGTMLRQRLHLSPFKSNGRYLLAVTDRGRLAMLYERYGVSEVKSDGALPGQTDQ